MASTYSQYKIELIGTGEQAGTWGTTTNSNFGSATPGTYQGFEQAIGGKATIDLSAGGTIALTLTNSNAAQNARALFFDLSGSPSGAVTLQVPAIQKSYIVKNGSGQTVTVEISGGTGVAVPNGSTTVVYADGTDVVTALNYAPALTLGAALPVASGGTGITSFGTGVATFLGTPSSANLAAAVTDETGSGALVFATSPLLVTPALGTPSSGTLTNATGLPLSTGVTGLLPVANGGTATATPSLVAGSNVTVSGTWPNQTIASSNSGGTVTSVSGTGTVQGLSLSGTVTSSGNLTLGGTLSAVNLTSQVTGTLPVANGGTGATTLTSNNVIIGNGTSAVQFVAPSTSGNVLTSNGTTWTSAAAPAAGFTLGTPVATTSGTSIDFTGIPAGIKQLIVNFYQVSTSGTDPINIQLGDSGGIETTGYIGEGANITAANTCNVQNSTGGFRIQVLSATSVLNGSITITLQNSSLNRWAASGNVSNQGNTQMMMTAGVKPLSAVLDRVRITTLGGSQTFDNGEINIAYI
jgi:hypothetical protein